MKNKQYWEEIGSELLAPTLLGFNNWLYLNVLNSQIQHVFFLARDGKIIFEAAKILTKDCRADYLLASRRAYNFAAIGSQLIEDDIDFLLSYSDGITVKSWLDRFNLDEKRASEALNLSNLSLNTIIKPELKPRLTMLITQLERQITAIAYEERKLLVEYLDQFNFFNYAKIAIVDIGWYGSLQHSLMRIAKLIGSKVEIYGYYLGIYNNRYKLANCYGWLCNHASDSGFRVLNSATPILEFFFTSEESSLLYFTNFEGKPIPVFDDYYCPDRSALKLLQNSAIGTLQQLKTQIRSLQESQLRRSILDLLEQRLINPRQEDLYYLGSLSHASGFGVNLKRQPILNHLQWWQRLLIFPILINFNSSLWMDGYKHKYPTIKLLSWLKSKLCSLVKVRNGS